MKSTLNSEGNIRDKALEPTRGNLLNSCPFSSFPKWTYIRPQINRTMIQTKRTLIREDTQLKSLKMSKWKTNLLTKFRNKKYLNARGYSHKRAFSWRKEKPQRLTTTFAFLPVITLKHCKFLMHTRVPECWNHFSSLRKQTICLTIKWSCLPIWDSMKVFHFAITSCIKTSLIVLAIWGLLSSTGCTKWMSVWTLRTVMSSSRQSI